MPLQAERELELFTPLGDDALLLESFHLSESLGQLFSLTVRVRLGKPDADVYSLINKAISIRMKMLNGKPRYLQGYVAGIREPGAGKSKRVFTLTVVPYLWYLSHKSDCRIFQEKSVKDIVSSILDQHGVVYSFKLEGTPRKWKYLTQYRETDLAFVTRLLEQEGMTFYFTHDDKKHTLQIVNAPGGFKPLPEYANINYHEPDSQSQHDAIEEWGVTMGVVTKQAALSDYDFKAPNKNLRKSKAVNFPHVAPNSELYDYPGEYWEPAEGDTYAQIRAEQIAAHAEVYSGEALCRGIFAGGTFKLADPTAMLAPSMVQEYLVTSTETSGANDEFTSGAAKGSHVKTSLTAMRAQRVFRPKCTTPKPMIAGPQTATVVGPAGNDYIHTDEHGRIKVQFHWDRYGKLDDQSSCWIRVSQQWAGQKWGMFFLPRIGQEVIVEFVDGDPDRPIVTGRVHNGLNMPPYALPANKTVSTIKTLSTEAGGGFNEVRFEDKKGSEMLFINAEKDHDLRVKETHKTFIGKDQHLIVKGKQSEKIEDDAGMKYAKKRAVAVDGDDSLKVKGAVKIEAGGNYTIKGDADLVQKITGGVTIDSSKAIYLKAASGLVIECSAGITLKCGGSSVVLDPSGVTVKGSMVTIDGSMVKIASGPGSSPGSGSAGSAGSADAPADPEEAMKTDPGEMAKREAEQAKRENYKLEEGATKTKNQEEKKDKPKKTWYEFKVVGPDGEAVKDEPVKVFLKGGKTLSKKTDSSGKVRVDEVEESEVEGAQLTERGHVEYNKVADINSGDSTKPFAMREDKEPEKNKADDDKDSGESAEHEQQDEDKDKEKEKEKESEGSESEDKDKS